jgi:hypothetical protein
LSQERAHDTTVALRQILRDDHVGGISIRSITGGVRNSPNPLADQVAVAATP